MKASSQRTWQLRLALMLILGVASVAVCVAAFMWWKAPAASAQVVASPEAVFVTRCNFSHRNMDDPIVFPGQPGAAHSHDFFANRSTKIQLHLQESLRTFSGTTIATKSGTTCVNPDDKSAYLDPYHELDQQQRHSYPQSQHRPLLLSVGWQTSAGRTAPPGGIEGGSQHARQLEVLRGHGCSHHLRRRGAPAAR